MRQAPRRKRPAGHALRCSGCSQKERTARGSVFETSSVPIAVWPWKACDRDALETNHTGSSAEGARKRTTTAGPVNMEG